MPRGVSLYDEARLQGRLWTPAMLQSASLIGLWDYSDLSSIATDASGNISQLADKSGHSYNATQATAASRPSLLPTGGPIGQACGFNNQQWLTASVPAGTFSGGLTFFSFWIKTGATTQYNASPANRTVGNIPSPLDSYNNQRWLGDGTNSTASNGFKNLGTDSVFLSWNTLVQYDAKGSLLEYVNDGAPLGPGGGQFGDTSTQICLGSRADAATKMIGRVCEVGAAAGAISSREIAMLAGYLAWKHARANNPLAASSPYKNRPPLIGG